MIRVRYSYSFAWGYDAPAYRLFKTEEEAHEWIAKAKKEIRGFKVEYVREEQPITRTNTPTIAPRYVYEGSTDAELLGMRY